VSASGFGGRIGDHIVMRRESPVPHGTGDDQQAISGLRAGQQFLMDKCPCELD